MAKFLATQSREGHSQFARELAGTHGSGWKVGSSAEELTDRALAALREGVEMLTAKDPEDIADYRELVLSLARQVSDAAPEGQDVEMKAVEAIRAALGY